MPEEVSISEDGRSSTITYGGSQPPTFEFQIRRAFKLMGGDPEKVGNLMTAWMDQDSALRFEVVPGLVAYYIRANIERIKAELEQGNENG